MSDSTFQNKSLYDNLQVPTNATQNEIKAAYRRLAKEYHPDVNRSPEASARMSEINHAYEVLSDPAKRSAYDTSQRVSSSLEDEIKDAETAHASAVAFAQRASCQGCGRFDHTLRITVFPYVFSILIMSFKRGEAGIFCESCRSSKSIKWGAISLLFGPWGVPWGIIWTVQSLIANLRKGNLPKEENKSFLLQLAWAQVILGKISDAKATLQHLLSYGNTHDTQELRDYFDVHHPGVKPSPSKSHDLRLSYVAVMLLILCLFGFIGYQIFSSNQDGTADTANTSISKNSAITQMNGWIDTYNQASERCTNYTGQYVTYDRALANASTFTRESDLFVTSIASMQQQIKNVKANMPDKYRALCYSFETWVDYERQCVNLYSQAIKTRNIYTWNQGVKLSVTADSARKNFNLQLDAL